MKTLSKRLDNIESKKLPLQCFFIMLNGYEFPQLSINGSKYYFSSHEQFRAFSRQFEDNPRVMILNTEYHERHVPKPIPKDAKYIKAWDENANFILKK